MLLLVCLSACPDSQSVLEVLFFFLLEGHSFRCKIFACGCRSRSGYFFLSFLLFACHKIRYALICLSVCLSVCVQLLATAKLGIGLEGWVKYFVGIKVRGKETSYGVLDIKCHFLFFFLHIVAIESSRRRWQTPPRGGHPICTCSQSSRTTMSPAMVNCKTPLIHPWTNLTVKGRPIHISVRRIPCTYTEKTPERWDFLLPIFHIEQGYIAFKKQ